MLRTIAIYLAIFTAASMGGVMGMLIEASYPGSLNNLAIFTGEAVRGMIHAATS